MIDDLGNLGFVLPPIYISVKQEAMAGSFHVHNHPGVLKIVNMKGNILQRYFTHNHFPRSLTQISHGFTMNKTKNHGSCSHGNCKLTIILLLKLIIYKYVLRYYYFFVTETNLSQQQPLK